MSLPWNTPPRLIAAVLEAGVIGTAAVFAFALHDLVLAFAWLVVANVGIAGGITAQLRMKGKACDMTTIKVGDSIALTWEGSDQREVDEVIAVGGGAVELKRNGYIRDDLPVWDDAAAQWVYCYARFSGS